MAGGEYNSSSWVKFCVWFFDDLLDYKQHVPSLRDEHEIEMAVLRVSFKREGGKNKESKSSSPTITVRNQPQRPETSSGELIGVVQPIR